MTAMKRGMQGGEPHQGSQRRPWLESALTSGLSIVFILFAFRDTLHAAYDVWTSSTTYGHGLFIAPISLFLIWRRRAELARITPQPSYAALLIVFAGASLWLVGSLAHTMVVAQFALVLMLQGAILALLGRQAAGRIAFPLLFLFMAVPFGDFLLPYLQDISAALVVEGLKVLQVPVHSDGVVIEVPGSRFQIAEACAGLRFMLPVVSLSLLYAYLMLQSLRAGAAFLIFAILVTLAANALRAMSIILAAYWYDKATAASFDHITYGWVFLSFVILLLFLCGLAFRKTGHRDETTRPHASALEAKAPGGAALVLLCVGALVLLFSAYEGIIERSLKAQAFSAQAEGFSFPAEVDGFKRENDFDTDWRPEFQDADREAQFRLRAKNGHVDLHIAYYAAPRPGAELITHANKIALLDGWIRLSSHSIGVSRAGQSFHAQATVLENRRGKRRLLLQWYWVAGRMTGKPAYAKALQALMAIIARRNESASLALSSPLGEDFGQSEALLKDLIAKLPPMEELLAQRAQTHSEAKGETRPLIVIPKRPPSRKSS